MPLGLLQSTFLSTGEDGVVMYFDLRAKCGPVQQLIVSEGRRRPVGQKGGVLLHSLGQRTCKPPNRPFFSSAFHPCPEIC
eukprot:1156387-Pelagomonas_calceolata.AAC.6